MQIGGETAELLHLLRIARRCYGHIMFRTAHVDTRRITSVTAVNIRDTEDGRVTLYQMLAPRGSTQDWMVIAPGSTSQILQGIQTVLSSVNVRDWENHQRFL